MPAKSYRSLLKALILIIFVALPSLSFGSKNLQEEARNYRDKGYAAQASGDLDTAMSYYQKAVELDPAYAVAYNDLAIIYDSKGFKRKAQEYYLKCLQIDPYYKSAYSNLANLYEEQGDLESAAKYWKKRIEIGDVDDPWTLKAKERLQNIGMIREDIGQELKQMETADLMKSIAREKSSLEDKVSPGEANQKERKEKAKKLYLKAKADYLKGDYAAALKEAVTAQYLDPTNSDIEGLINKTCGKLGAYNQ